MALNLFFQIKIVSSEEKWGYSKWTSDWKKCWEQMNILLEKKCWEQKLDFRKLFQEINEQNPINTTKVWIMKSRSLWNYIWKKKNANLFIMKNFIHTHIYTHRMKLHDHSAPTIINVAASASSIFFLAELKRIIEKRGY